MYAVRAYKAGEFRKIVVSGALTGEHLRLVMIAEGIPRMPW